MQDGDPLETITPEQAAGLLQVKTQTVWRMIRRGDLPAIRVGRAYRIPRPEFAVWLEEHRVTKRQSDEDHPHP